MNRYFVSVFTVEDTNNMPKIDDRKAMAGEDRETIIITKEVMLGKLMGLKVDKSSGPDGMHPRVLRDGGRNSKCISGNLPKFAALWGGSRRLENSKCDSTVLKKEVDKRQVTIGRLV